MSHQNIADAFAPAEARYRAQVMAETWGHLAPKRNKIYRGHVTFAIGCFGSDHLNPTCLSCEFEDLESSPWFFDALNDFLQSLETEAGCVYRFDGTFRNYEFKGTVKTVYNSAVAAEQSKG
jgi:hypothetical protein